jgi:DNA-directed RNA polymerase specialized sigma24 family protein
MSMKSKQRRRAKTSEIRAQVNEVCDAYLRGEIDFDTAYAQIEQLMRPIIRALIDYYERKVNQQFTNIVREDIEIACLEGIVFALRNLKQSDNYFSFIRKHVKGSILTLIRNLAFANVANQGRLEKIPLSLLSDEDSDIEPADADEDADAKNLALFGTEDFPLAELELRDFIAKLPDAEREIATKILEGYEVDELRFLIDDFDAHFERLKAKLAEFFSL